LSRMHSSNPPLRVSDSTPWTHGHAVTLGEFLGEKRWLLARYPCTGPVDDLGPVRPGTDQGHSSSDQLEADPTLGLLLDAIADEVHKIASAARDGIVAEFAARVAHARKCLPRNQLSATLRGLAEARKAALALVKRNAAAELAGRKKAALAARRRARSVRAVRASPSRPMGRH
jgi:hypothetical protein